MATPAKSPRTTDVPIIGLSILVQLACAVHCVRNGRNGLWLMVIIFLSLPGCLAYAIFEILPQYRGGRAVRSAREAAARKLDPQREVRAARDALDLVDTAANRIALGDALVGTGAYSEACGHYRAALGKAPGADRETQLKLAAAELESGDAAGARRHLETLPESGSASENDRARLLLARALDACGEREEAVALYADVGQRLPGGEAHCRRAALLIAMGREGEAEQILSDVAQVVKRLDRYQRSQNRDMYDWAARTLDGLRSRT